MSNNSQISSNWPGFRKIWGVIAVILFLLLLLLWALGYGPGGRNCEVPPTIVEKVVEKEKIIDNPVLLTQIADLEKAKEKETGMVAELKAKIAELEAMPPKVVTKEVDNPELLKKIGLLETENGLIPGLKAKIGALEKIDPIVIKKADAIDAQLTERLAKLEKENGLIEGLRAKITALEGISPLTVNKASPEFSERLAKLEKENALIPGLKAKITALEGINPITGGKENPELAKRIEALEKENGLIPGLKAKITALENIDPITIKKEDPELAARLAELEKENGLIAGLKAKIAALESIEPVTVTKEVDNPKLLNKVNFLEIENKLIPGLRSRIKELESAKPKMMQAPAGDLPDTAKLYFRINSASRPANTTKTLSGIIDYLKDNDGSKVLVSGFHDATGNLELNQILSLKRAEAVVVALKRAGISADQIIVAKPTQTVGSGTRNEARRVEVKIAQ
ncbi:OmpA family protein [uncultured Cocleimonas sp.]|uniref:OmpA family protein n=1 Tax=uncultured Cocleimonas sp. TaxID=1051587 RepID=UPI002629569F|nr:OmpA family protein [uncultured Cocleimonas sp.]